jgi:hypothetical protein
MKQSQFYYLLRRGLFSGGSAIIKSGLVMFNKFTTAGLSFPVQGSAGFNGTSDYIDTDNPFSHTNHTIAAWVYNTDDTNPNILFDARDDNDDGYRVMPYNGLFYYSVNTSDLTFTNVKDQWVYVVGTYDGSTMKLYKDGSVTGSLSTSQTINTTTNARISKVSYTDLYSFNGNLANVAIWNRALTSDEINSVMWKPVQALTATESNGLQAWYSLDDIASPTASLASMEQLATDKNLIIENKAAITAAVNSLS